MVKKRSIGNALKIIASIKLAAVCLAILVVLTAWGTVYQADHGLYQAQQKFFHSWFFFIFGFIPFPGTVLVLFVLFINLVAALFYRIGFRLAKIGNLITHTGIMVLLIGGFFTFYFSQEFSLMLKEGETSSLAESSRSWELAVREQKNGDIFAVDTAGLKHGEIIDFPGLSLRLQVEAYYENCAPLSAQPGARQAGPVFNVSGIKALRAMPAAAEISDNMPGLVFKIVPAAVSHPQVLLYGADEAPTTTTGAANRTFSFSLGKKKIALPLALTLVDFRVGFYPNSSIPKSYESTVRIEAGGGVEREVVISMNKPLRYKDLTFFQSSYMIDREGGEYTILAVVRNAGRLLPYIAGIWIFLGLLIHFLLKSAGRGGAHRS